MNNAAALGIVTGYEDGTFRPYKTISRQEAVAMLDRLYQVLGGKTDAVSEKAFADDAFTADSATYKQAMTAYYTAYQQYSSQASSASSKWTEYANGLYAKANISIYGLFA